MAVNWKAFGSPYIKFEDGTPKRLLLTNWRDGVAEFEGQKKPSVDFDVLEEDDSGRFPTPRTLQVTSPNFIAKLQPICVAAEQAGRDVIDVTVTRVGKGKQTQYGVAPTAQKSAAPAAVNPTTDARAKLANAKEMLAQGLITEESYNKMAAKYEAAILEGN